MLAARPVLVQCSQLRLIERIQMHLLLLVKNFTEIIGKLISLGCRSIVGNIMMLRSILAILWMLASVYLRYALGQGVLRCVRVLMPFHQISFGLFEQMVRVGKTFKFRAHRIAKRNLD